MVGTQLRRIRGRSLDPSFAAFRLGEGRHVRIEESQAVHIQTFSCLSYLTTNYVFCL